MAADAKLYYLPKSLLVRLIYELTEGELSELASDTAKNDLVDISLFLEGGFTIASISDIAETWLKISQMPFISPSNKRDNVSCILMTINLEKSTVITENTKR